VTIIDDARADVAAAVAKRDEWTASLVEHRARLAEVDTGAVVLEEGPAAVGELAWELGGARAAVELTERGLAAAEAEVVAAWRVAVQAGAAMLRSRAELEEREAVELDARIAQLLARLEEEAGATFRPVARRIAVATGDVLEEVVDPSATYAGRRRLEARRLRELADEADGFARGRDVTAETYLRWMAKVDPDGPEAMARAEQKAAKSEEAARSLGWYRDLEQRLADWKAARRVQLLEATPAGANGAVARGPAYRAADERVNREVNAIARQMTDAEHQALQDVIGGKLRWLLERLPAIETAEVVEAPA
jgi:hypothetical protein